MLLFDQICGDDDCNLKDDLEIVANGHLFRVNPKMVAEFMQLGEIRFVIIK